MPGDILNDPLGQDRGPKPQHRNKGGAALVVIGIAALGAVSVWTSTQGPRPVGGVVSPIETAKPTERVQTSVPALPKAVLNAADVDEGSGVKIVRPPGSLPASAAIIKIPESMSVSLQSAPDPRLVEKSRFGLLPRRGADGTRPAEVYARPLVLDSTLKPEAPRIAIVVGGMGLNPMSTTSAVAELPPDVTLGFAPYGDDLDRQVQKAREAGHETILQVPMEGFGDPTSTAMSHLLEAGLDGREVLDRLHWHMGRFTGYVAVANFLGGKFTAESAAFAPVLHDVASRGLFYLDDGTAPRSLASSMAKQEALPFVRAEIVIDASGDPSAIGAALDRLEARARSNGVAVGFANGLPAAIGRIAAFAAGLAARGIALVPCSALATPPSAGTRAEARP